MVISYKGHILGDKICLADNFIQRLKGLMGKKTLNSGEGLLLKNCSSIHCCFMKIPIDAVYLSKDMTVLDIETILPWGIGKRVKYATHVLEIAAFSASIISVGDKLEIKNL